MTTDRLPPKSIQESTDTGKTVSYDQPWLKSLLHPFLIAVLVACLDTAWLALIARFVPALAGGYGQIVLGFSILVTVLGCVTTTILAQPGQRRRAAYRWVEFAFVVVATRLILWAVTGNWPTLDGLIYRPLASLFDGAFFSAGLVVIFSWIVALELMGDLLRLALQPDELHALETDRIGEMIRSSNTDRPTILARIVARWVAGGILMVMAAAGLQVERPATGGFLALTQQNIDPSVVAAIVLYFLAGLILVSQGQLALLRTRWLLDRVPSTESVLRQWPFYVMLLLLAIGILAALLPFGGTFLLAQILFGIIGFVFNFFLSIFRFFMGLLLLLIGAFTGDAPETPLPETPPAPPPPMLEQLPPAAAQLPAWTGGALFWTVMILFLSYAAYIYLSDRGVKFTWLATFWRLLRERWQMLFGTLRQWQQRMVPGRASNDDAIAETPRVHWSKRGLDWRRLEPTQQIRYFYLTTLEQAQGRGIGRTRGETPAQYAPRLAEHLAAQTTETEQRSDEVRDQQAVQKLTDAFIQARYSKKLVQKPESNALVQVWENLKVYLRL